jgi:hypothetical protein
VFFALRFTGGAGGLGAFAGLGLAFGAGLGFSFSAGLGFAFAFGAGGFGAFAGFDLAFGAGLGFSFSAGLGFSFSAGLGFSFSAGLGFAFAFGAGGFGAFAGFGLAFGAGLGFALAFGAFAGLGLAFRLSLGFLLILSIPGFALGSGCGGLAGLLIGSGGGVALGFGGGLAGLRIGAGLGGCTGFGFLFDLLDVAAGAIFFQPGGLGPIASLALPFNPGLALCLLVSRPLGLDARFARGCLGFRLDPGGRFCTGAAVILAVLSRGRAWKLSCRAGLHFRLAVLRPAGPESFILSGSGAGVDLGGRPGFPQLFRPCRFGADSRRLLLGIEPLGLGVSGSGSLGLPDLLFAAAGFFLALLIEPGALLSG